MSDRPARRLLIRGRVQGVGYRYAMVDAARELGIAGWVRNRSDGCVEALVQGEPQQIDAIVAWARKGPRGARVDAIEIEPAEGEFDGFEQRPSA